MTQCDCDGLGYIVTGLDTSYERPVTIIKKCKVCGSIFDAYNFGEFDLAVGMTDEALSTCEEKQEDARL